MSKNNKCKFSGMDKCVLLSFALFFILGGYLIYLAIQNPEKYIKPSDNNTVITINNYNKNKIKDDTKKKYSKDKSIIINNYNK